MGTTWKDFLAAVGQVFYLISVALKAPQRRRESRIKAEKKQLEEIAMLRDRVEGLERDDEAKAAS